MATSSVIPARISVNRFFSRRASSSLSRSARGRCCLMGASGSCTNKPKLEMSSSLGVLASLLQYCGVSAYQLSDQRNGEGSAALPPQVQRVKRVLPDRHRRSPSQGLAGRHSQRHGWRRFVNSPTHIFGVVFYVVRKISNLIFGNALQPVNNQLQHTQTC